MSPADAALTEAVDALIEFGGLMLRTGTEAFRVRQRMGELARAMGIEALALHVLLGSIEVTARRWQRACDARERDCPTRHRRPSAGRS